MKEIRKLTILTKQDIFKELKSIFGYGDKESNERCYQCIKYHMCPLDTDDSFCTGCIISGATWIFEPYEVGE